MPSNRRTPRVRLTLAAIAGAASAVALAQGMHAHTPGAGGAPHHLHPGAQPIAAGAASPTHGPYAGQQQRAIKALSPEQIAGLREGRGLGMAMPAELNGYPGPLHTLQLAQPLKLSAQQIERTQALYQQMQDEARAGGEAVIAAEAALDRLFREREATSETVAAAAAQAAQASGALRATHLRYHLHMMEVLTPEQVRAYHRLRGYDTP